LPNTPKKHTGSLAQFFSDMTGFPTEALTDIPLLICKGPSEMVTEGCRAILEYSRSRIRLDMRKKILLVEGADLVMSEFRRNSLRIRGQIHRICWEG